MGVTNSLTNAVRDSKSDIKDWSVEEDKDGKELIVETREDMVGMPVYLMHAYSTFLDITPEETKQLENDIAVTIFVGGPYFASKKATVVSKALLNVDKDCLFLNTPLFELRFALKDKWAKKNYGHNFEDFVIDVFDMKITEGKVEIHIELGS